MVFKERINRYQSIYHDLKTHSDKAEEKRLPGKAYFIENNEILCLPREDGDSRYPLGQDGLNYWVYASGYIHSNEGLFSHYLRATEGQEPKIAFFAGFKEGETYEVLPILSVPVVLSKIQAERYTIFRSKSAYYITEAEGVRFTLRTLVDEYKNFYWSLMVENKSNERKSLSVSSYFNPFLKHGVMEGAENRWFRQASIVPKTEVQNADSFLIEVYEEKSRGAMAAQYAVFKRHIETLAGGKVIKVDQTTSRNDYVGGIRSSLHTPMGLRRGCFEKSKKVTAFTEIGIAADLLHLELEQGGAVRLDTVMTCCFDEEKKEAALSSSVIPEEIDQIEDRLINQDQINQSGIKIRFGTNRESKEPRTQIKAEVFNSFVEHLKRQVAFCALIKGYVQLSSFSLIGIRDVFQALEGLLIWQPDAARAKMLEALGFIQPDGRAPRQYALPPFEGADPAMDLRAFIDQGVWIISTVITYLKYTGDFDFLNERCGYYEFVDEGTHRAKKADQESTVLEHLLNIMAYLLKNRDTDHTGCIFALYGDWNDALDGLGVSQDKNQKYGTGVSVMATLQVYQNCHEMIELLNYLDKAKYKEQVKRYEEAGSALEEALLKYAVVQNEAGEKKIIHGWGDKRSYLVGSFKDPDGLEREGVTSNAFWVLSGMHGKGTEMKQTILKAYEKLDSKYGLRTFYPHFEKGTKGVGRIPNLPKGTAENGAAYSHASAFGMMSLFKMGEAERAWEQLAKIVPFTHQTVSVSPYVAPNSYGENREKAIDGESMQDWQTGSSNVIFKTLVRFVIGIQPEYEGVWIQPAKHNPFEDMEMHISLRGCKVIFKYSCHNRFQRVFKINGVSQSGIYDGEMQQERVWIAYKQMRAAETMVVEIMD